MDFDIGDKVVFNPPLGILWGGYAGQEGSVISIVPPTVTTKIAYVVKFKDGTTLAIYAQYLRKVARRYATTTIWREYLNKRKKDS